MTTEASLAIDLNEFFSIEEENSYTVLYFKDPAKKIIVYDPGLYHTAICKSRLCKIDKTDGKLYYRGANVVEKLSESFLDVAFEIVFGSNKRLSKFKDAVTRHFDLLPEQQQLLDSIPSTTHPMDVLSIATINLGGIEQRYLQDPADTVEKAAFLIAQVAITVSYRYTKANGKQWLKPDPNLFYPQAILRQMHPDENNDKLGKLGRILNTIMILHAEHGQNCSSVAVRNTASARGSIYTAVAAGMGAFNGAIHGGASQHVSAMYDEILNNDLNIDDYVEEKIRRKELLMGFGQRTYNRIKNCWDPRVETMNRILMNETFDLPEVQKYRDIAVQLMKQVVNHPFFKEKNLTPNPDLFNCIFYKLFGVPKEMNTTMLALGRIAGWIANYVEHTKDQYPLTRPCDLTVT